MGCDARSLEDVYPGRSQQVQDTEWIADAAQHRVAVLTKNPGIVLVPHEFDAVQRHGTKVFCLPSGQGTRETEGLLFGRHWLTILRRVQRPGPCFWRLYPDRISRDLG